MVSLFFSFLLLELNPFVELNSFVARALRSLQRRPGKEITFVNLVEANTVGSLYQASLIFLLSKVVE